MYICVCVYKMKETINLRVSKVEIWEELKEESCNYIL